MARRGSSKGAELCATSTAALKPETKRVSLSVRCKTGDSGARQAWTRPKLLIRAVFAPPLGGTDPGSPARPEKCLKMSTLFGGQLERCGINR